MTEEEQLSNISRWMKEDPYATAFVRDFFIACHLWDDLIDRDQEVSPESIDGAFWRVMVSIPSNPFYQRHINELQPVIATAILDWFAANELETGDDHERHISYTLRCGILSIITYCAMLVGGPEWARAIGPEIRRFGQRETLAEYMGDLRCRT